MWSCIKKEEKNVAGFIRAYLGECSNGQWVVVITDMFWEKSEILLFDNRKKATERIRERGFMTRLNQIFAV